MKLNEFHQNLQDNSEYIEAIRELKLQFEVANWILRARLKKGWTQTDLARAIGTKQANISRIEAGLANPTISIIQKLFNVLDLEMNINPAGQEIYTHKITGLDYGDSALNGYAVPNWPKADFCPMYDIKSDASIEEGKLE